MRAQNRATRRHPLARPLALAVAVVLWTAVGAAAERIVAVGDIHGNVQGFQAILRAADLLDGEGRWAGGDVTLVQTGDFVDRGPGVRAVMDLLMRLETEAAQAGGRVVVLLGNHEVMNMMRVLRDVTPEIYATFADARSEVRRGQGYAAYRAWAEAVSAPAEDEADWLESHPPGYFAYQEAFEPDGYYGRWLRAKPIIARIDGSIFLHGGIHPAVSPPGLEEKIALAREELSAFDRDRGHLIEVGTLLPFSTFDEMLAVVRALRNADAPEGMAEAVLAATRLAELSAWSIVDQNGPLWFRGFALWQPADGQPQIRRLLSRYGAERFVVGHSVLRSRRITPRFDAGVFLIDTGMLASVYEGEPSALEIDAGRITAVYVDERETLVEATAPAAADR